MIKLDDIFKEIEEDLAVHTELNSKVLLVDGL